MWLVFDIETIPDAEAGRRLLRCSDDQPDDAVRGQMLDERRSHTGGSDFLKPAFHQVVAIACALIDDQGHLRRIRALGNSTDSEDVLVQEFFRIVQDARPRLVGWNSSGFDLPTLIYRAIRHQVVTPTFYQVGEPYHGYRKRFDEEGHLDLMDVLSGYGASARLSLHEMAMLLGIPGKLEVSGDDVLQLFNEGDHEAIRAYCMHDVLTTTLIFGRYAHHRGWMDEAVWQTFANSVYQFLDESADNQWTVFREQWDAIQNRKELWR